MAAGVTGRAHPSGGHRGVVVEASAEPQPALLGRLTQDRWLVLQQQQLLIEQRHRQPPGPGGGGLIQGLLEPAQTRLERQLGRPGHGLGQALGPEHPGPTAGEQQLRCLLALPQSLEMAGQQIERRLALPATGSGLGHRDLQLLKRAARCRRQGAQGLRCQAMVQGRCGRTPLQQRPLHLLGTGCRPVPIQHHQSRIGRTATQQSIGVGQHNGQGLGRRADQQQPPLQAAKPLQLPPLTGLLTGRIKPVKRRRTVAGVVRASAGRNRRQNQGKQHQSPDPTERADQQRSRIRL